MALLAAMAVLLMLGAASAQQEQVTVLRGSGDNETATWVLKVRPMIPSRGSRASAGGAPCTKPTQQLRLLRNCERARSCGCGGPCVMPLCPHANPQVLQVVEERAGKPVDFIYRDLPVATSSSTSTEPAIAQSDFVNYPTKVDFGVGWQPLSNANWTSLGADNVMQVGGQRSK